MSNYGQIRLIWKKAFVLLQIYCQISWTNIKMQNLIVYIFRHFHSIFKHRTYTWSLGYTRRHISANFFSVKEKLPIISMKIHNFWALTQFLIIKINFNDLLTENFASTSLPDPRKELVLALCLTIGKNVQNISKQKFCNFNDFSQGFILDSQKDKCFLSNKSNLAMIGHVLQILAHGWKNTNSNQHPVQQKLCN